MALSTIIPMQSTSEKRTMSLLDRPKTLRKMKVNRRDSGMEREVMTELRNPMAK